MCRSYTTLHSRCMHKGEPQFRYCPERERTCDEIREENGGLAMDYCEACYLNPKISMKQIDPDEPAWETFPYRQPTALELDYFGNIWERVRQSERMNNIPASDLDAFNDPLNRDGVKWLRDAHKHMDLDILHRYLNRGFLQRYLGSRTLDEKEILVMFRVGRSLLNVGTDIQEQYIAEGRLNLAGAMDRIMGPRRRWDEGEGTYIKFVDPSSLSEDKRACWICMQPFGSSKLPALPERPCKVSCTGGHTFGSDCILRWLEIKKNCPLCREELVPLEADESEAMPTPNAIDTPWWLKVMRGD